MFVSPRAGKATQFIPQIRRMWREGDAKRDNESGGWAGAGRTFLDERHKVRACQARCRRFGWKVRDKKPARSVNAARPMRHALAIRRLQTHQVEHETKRQIFGVGLCGRDASDG